MRSIEEIVVDWCARDRGRALLPADHAIIASTPPLRALVVELARGRAADGPDGSDPEKRRDLFHACAVLGQQIAELGGSPTLAVSTIESARESLGDAFAPFVEAARAALAEGYVKARLEAASAEAAARWEYPRCAVAIEADSVAIAAGFPEDDGEALAAWAARVASAAAREGRRRAFLAGGEAARNAVADALSLAGIDVRVSSPPPRARPR
jgi:hypothetical protein